MSSQLCALLSAECLLIVEDVLQSLLNMCLADVCSSSSINHLLIKLRELVKRTSHLRGCKNGKLDDS